MTERLAFRRFYRAIYHKTIRRQRGYRERRDSRYPFMRQPPITYDVGAPAIGGLDFLTGRRSEPSIGPEALRHIVQRDTCGVGNRGSAGIAAGRSPASVGVSEARGDFDAVGVISAGELAGAQLWSPADGHGR